MEPKQERAEWDATLKAVIRGERSAAGMTAPRMAAAAGISRTGYWRIETTFEKGGSVVLARDARMIARVLGLTLDELFHKVDARLAEMPARRTNIEKAAAHRDRTHPAADDDDTEGERAEA